MTIHNFRWCIFVVTKGKTIIKNIMKVDLTVKNENTLYVVFDTKKNNVLLETESLEKARSFVDYNANTDYSTYQPFTYAKNKIDIAEDYSTTFLEY